MRNVIRLAICSLVAACGLTFTSCSSSGIGLGNGLDTPCSSFLTMTKAQQIHLASEWAYPARNGDTNGISDAVASGDRDQLVLYCGQPGHSGDKLSDLDQTVTP